MGELVGQVNPVTLTLDRLEAVWESMASVIASQNTVRIGDRLATVSHKPTVSHNGSSAAVLNGPVASAGITWPAEAPQQQPVRSN